MTDDEQKAAHAAYMKWTNPHGHKRRDDLAFDAGYAAACEAKGKQLAAACSSSQALVDDVESALLQLKAERVRSARLEEENERLRYDAQKIYADYMDRGAAIRETGDMVRSLYAPKNEKLNKEVGQLTRHLKAERARSAKLIEALNYMTMSLNGKVHTVEGLLETISNDDRVGLAAIAEYEATK